MSAREYKIGTRGSLLAKTQTQLTHTVLEELGPFKWSVQTFKTQGDLNTQVPLWQLEGKDFFTKELDEALLKKQVDLVVHSYKDLGSERPAGIKLAAILERKFPHDILLISDKTTKNLKNLNELVIGTSSPRRVVNLESSIAPLLPLFKGKVSTQTLRGNVNTRIEKLKNGEYGAIVLALAGLERLASLPSSRQTLTGLLDGLNFMVLPCSQFPAAASQGALALETRVDELKDSDFLELMAKIQHEDTRQEVEKERLAFNQYGGGCHLAVGVTVRKVNGGMIEVHKGQVDGKDINFSKFHRTNPLPKMAKDSKFFLGMPSSKIENPKDNIVYDQLIEKKVLDQLDDLQSESNYFVTSSYCIETVSKVEKKFIWASGNRTLKKLIDKGIWVNGSADQLGHEEIVRFKNSNTIKILTKNQGWSVLGHEQSSSEVGQGIKCYDREIVEMSESFKKQVEQCAIFYWTSSFQYLTYLKYFPEISTKIHCSGMGRTKRELEKIGVDVHGFYLIADFLNWQKSGESK